MNSYKVVIIGAGNVAYHLIRSITSSGNKLVQICNRTLGNIQPFSQTNITGNLNAIRQDADIYIICVKDIAIADIASKINLGNKLIVHTSGNRSMDLLKDCSTNYGVFYPIQSFTKNIPINFKKVPLILEASNDEAQEMLVDFSRTISNQVILMNELDRQKLNVAGVFVNNFTNYIYSLAHDYLSKEGIDFNIVQPLIQNTVDKLVLGNPQDMQTGPAVRNDLDTIQAHTKLLENYPQLKEIYQEVTQSIINYYKKS
ncbi:MAG: Rossmann-like and DUF2520 domain-containing protein [Chitinophagales bacterium]|jgi:predicted short-subunit dehydrogenase-like oxidoreductase (DUF2520 family)|nr:DUF2520 domain-containing protein [Sphingobacteriales bacterium]